MQIIRDKDHKTDVLKTVPASEGFRMPGEYEEHKGCVLIWPVRPGTFTNCGKEAKITFTVIARAIAESEEVYLLCDKDHYNEVTNIFAEDLNIKIINIETNDSWARDTGPTCVIDKSGEVRGISWKFNAWGGEYDGLYTDYELDDKAAVRICEELKLRCYELKDFVLEGGSIHSDGEGTLLVTAPCLLSKGRNPGLSKEEIEAVLKDYLGVKKIIWLPRGIAGDETNEHVDNICAFVRPGEVVLAWTEDPSDIQYGPSNECMEFLKKEKDAKGRTFKIHKLPIPKKPVCITKEELEALSFEPGEDIREEGERLAASYVNFYISNNGVIFPQFGDENDKIAVEIISKVFPDRKIYPVNARSIIVGGGNIHCITQQIPGRSDKY
ncbi:MAG: agmatine deiminase [Lachnospiraceae bacterium]|nr:agmatine deiminase [Lachnospiraceae bacterium]